MVGCEYDGPAAVWDPNQPLGESPAIEQVVPASRAAAGANEITLMGRNFSAAVGGNKVYVSGTEIPVKSASQNEIKIPRPTVVGDSLLIRLRVDGAAILASHYPYRVDEVKFLVDGLEGNASMIVIAVDRDENLYALNSQRVIRKVMPDGQTTDYPALPTRINARFVTEMRVGPNGYLYLARNLGNFDRVPPGGGAPETFGSIPLTVEYFDFDENGNIFAGGRRGLSVVDPAGTATPVGQYDGFVIKAVRVFAPYVYVAANYTGTDPSIPAWAIWRNSIQSSSGSLGDKQLFFNWAQSGDLANAPISAMTLDENGNVYVGTSDRVVVAPVLMISSDGSTSEALYWGILEAGAERLVWGTGNSLYLARGSASQITNRRVFRIDVGKKGAPDYGRL
jgi:hypothetical protein